MSENDWSIKYPVRIFSRTAVQVETYERYKKSMEKECEKMSKKISKSIAQIIRENEELAAENKTLKSKLAKAQEECDNADNATELLLEKRDKEIFELREKLHNAVDTANRLDDELANAREEVTKLKAKIYDLEHQEEEE